jgi:hypothetical protein
MDRGVPASERVRRSAGTKSPDRENDRPDPTAIRPISSRSTLAVLSALVIGAIIGGMAVEYWFVKHVVVNSAAQTAAPTPGLAADVAQLKRIMPVQSHTMHDVGYHWANLWFAAEKKNWPLATYFFNEARQAVRWTVLIRPVRQLPGGGTVDISGIFDSIDPGAFATVQIALEDQDSAAFVSVQAGPDGLPQLPLVGRSAVPASSRSDRPGRRS